MRAVAVVDLGFGDAGKGTIVDALVRRTGAHLVVRTQGGAQAGHNVVTDDGRHHTFAQLGAGSFVPGVRTHLGPEMVVHPTALLVEARYLADVGVGDALDRLTVAREARVTTPFHQAAGRLRELARGDGAHGSCGVGVGETVYDSLTHPDEVLRVGHLSRADLPSRVARVRERVRSSVSEAIAAARGRAGADPEIRVFEDPGVIDAWIEALTPFATVRAIDDATCALDGELVVLEGAHGILLDEHHGFHPHTTWHRCTSAPAEEWLAARGFDGELVRLGVTRTYATRHGAGPFPSQADALRASLREPHNPDRGWQGTFRVGWPDPSLLRYAIAANRGIDALAVTHLDRLGALDAWRSAARYTIEPRLDPTLRYQSALAERLAAPCATEALELGDDPAEGYLDWIERELGVRAAVLSSGPTAGDKVWLEPALT
ncbi:MAG: adenylosuccinate synthetase [Sandaracinaceae bacterium]